MALTPGSRLGPYEVLAPIGAGGMGEIYLRTIRLARDVAVKVLPAEFADYPERLRRFELEARAASALNRPNMLTIFEIGSHEGAPYVLYEHFDGDVDYPAWTSTGKLWPSAERSTARSGASVLR